MGILQKLSNFYFSKKALPYWCILLIDCAVVAFSFYLTYYLRYGGIEFAMNFWPLTAGILVSLIPFVASFRIFHTYTGIVRYSSFVDLQRVAIASFISALIVWALGVGLDYFWPEQTFLLIPDAKSIFLIFVICTVLLWAERVVVKRLFDSFNTDNAIPVVIYGTKAGGISVAKSIISVKKKKYTVKAFISDGKEMQGAYLMGKPVYLNEKGLAGRLSEMGVKAILVSPLKAEKFRDNTSMVDEVIAAGMKIMMMSGGEEWDGKSALNHEHFQEVDIEDLLPREKIQIDMDAIGALLSGKRILITGAAGSIGSEMVRQVAKFNPAEMILIDQALSLIHI